MMGDKEEIANATRLQEEKEALRQEMLQDELHERNMSTDWDYFLEHSNFNELKDLYDKLHSKAWSYGWFCNLKDYL